MDSSSISEGTEIRYRLHWHRVPIRWTMEIRQWDAPYRFVDFQKSGPYKSWHHTHRFESHEGQTKMIDVVRYVGGELLKALLASGDPVRCLARRPEVLRARVSPD